MVENTGKLHVERFCCYVDLKFGCYYIATLSMVVTTLECLMSMATFTMKVFSYTYTTVHYVLAAIALIFAGVMIIFSAVLIVAVREDAPRAIKLWIGYAIFYAFLEFGKAAMMIIFLIDNTGEAKSGFHAWAIVDIFFYLGFCGYLLYCVFAVLSYVKKMDDE